ncbi:L-lysine 2-3-aminomutase [Penicillium mononematosum]|uniref:L-lysine 2-3-aminomutase n=1 Tax=Penicillium mononematosum TaxID=268346 RepID=UPI00254883B7|nr:L-lysine 2-3-aminomutase [Penicillium mononematosum]KAJ6186417.1 L-lysine 2-3-aminomutase [Penicillium mononematosum]
MKETKGRLSKRPFKPVTYDYKRQTGLVFANMQQLKRRRAHPSIQSYTILPVLSFFSSYNLIHTTIGWLPVRSAVLKPHAGELVVGWVTTSESSLLYVFVVLSFAVILNAPSTPKWLSRA